MSNTTLLGYLARGSYGTDVKLTNPKKPPRKQLLDYMGRKHADKIYCDLKSGGSQHIGYIVGREWFAQLLEGVTV